MRFPCATPATMATADMALMKPKRLPPRPRPPQSPLRRLLWRRVFPAFTIIALVALAFFWTTIRDYGLAGTAYGARIGCSCRYLGGRETGDCRKDFEPGMALVVLSADDDARTVTARLPLVASQTARYRKGEGCVLDPWDQ